jgi:methionyl-tRNA synthetase
MARKYFPNQSLAAPAQITHSAEIRESFEKLIPELQKAVSEVNPSAYAQACTARSRVLNLYIDRTKPWALAKANTPESLRELHEVIYTLMEGIRWVATALYPILPFGMPEVFRQLNVAIPPQEGALIGLKWALESYQPGEPKPIYPRLELPQSEKTS